MKRLKWNKESPVCMQVFCAALQGICANPAFFGPIFQQSPQAAVEFADQVVLVALYDEYDAGDPDEDGHELTRPNAQFGVGA